MINIVVYDIEPLYARTLKSNTNEIQNRLWLSFISSIDSLFPTNIKNEEEKGKPLHYFCTLQNSFGKIINNFDQIITSKNNNLFTLTRHQS